MGYYTNYRLEVSGKGPIYDKLIREADTVFPNEVYGYSLQAFINDEAESIKWYDYQRDMAAVSKDWPNVLFTMICIGEDHEVWCVHFMNGTIQEAQAKIAFDEPDFKVLRYIPDAELKAVEDRKAELKAELEKIQAELDSLG